MKRMLGLALATMTFCLLGGCSATHHRPTVGPGGQMNVLITCRTRTPQKCEIRAHEVCGTYSTVEPLHVSSEDPIESAMVVHCTPPAAAPPG